VTIRAVLYRAKGDDREIDLERDEIRIADDQLLWVDLDTRETGDLRRAAAAVGLEPEALERLSHEDRRARIPDVGPVWPGTIERLERAIDGVENARELLIGSVDLYLGRSSQRTNDVMKVLTLVSAIALPAVVLAGVMGMNFKPGFFDDPNNYWVVVGAMIAFALVILAVARWRRWI
jgi:Mg2+ and Co2+ transporter CorA